MLAPALPRWLAHVGETLHAGTCVAKVACMGCQSLFPSTEPCEQHFDFTFRRMLVSMSVGLVCGM